jgi:phosphopantothenoylcysteine decarboxylase/phosphopantothenate--cysteine ligase
MDNKPALAHRQIVVGLTGGIACYKTADLVSKLVQCECKVQVVMTSAAAKFMTPLTFESLTGRAVYDSQWAFVEERDPQHIRIAKQADLMIIAPCTMNMLAALANGFTDDPVSLVAAAIDKKNIPVILAPSMNSTMLQQNSTQRNLNTLQDDGFTVVHGTDGWQACKTQGHGRMAEPKTLLNAIESILT